MRWRRSRRPIGLVALVGSIIVLAAAVAGCGADPSSRADSPSTSATSTPSTSASTSTSAVSPRDVNATILTTPTTVAAAEGDRSAGPLPPPDVPPIVVPTVTLAPVVVRPGADTSLDAAVGDPLSISVASIGVDSPLVEAGLLEDGSVAVPPDPSIAGWFTGGPRPGERGPAVIMGHVDSKASGPGVFYHLRDIEPGDRATVQTTTGPVEFVVQAVQQYPKDQFPTDAVYGATPTPTLRLITCGGSFDRSIGHYRDNIVAFLVPMEAAR